ncbi:MAG: stage II sporulation protein P [Turicibacter sp.]|nr:stage II sporulation protein P [Turicibacter sp.]
MQQTQANKFTILIMAAVLFLALHATQFFPIFYATQKSAYDRYVENKGGISLLADFAFTHKFDGLETYMLQVITGVYVMGPPVGTAPHEYSYSPTEKEVNTMLGNDPIVYIYNTHSTESIAGTVAADGTVTEGDVLVTDLSQLMAQALQKRGVPSLVEERDTQDIVEGRGWEYYQSYDVSRELLKSAWEHYPTFKYFIDLHRDATIGDEATIVLNGKPYAIIQIVVGTHHTAFAENVAVANDIAQHLEKNHPGLTTKNIVRLSGGAGNNGVYNQDISPNTILFEIGGQDTSLEAATNSINAIADVLAARIN